MVRKGQTAVEEQPFDEQFWDNLEQFGPPIGGDEESYPRIQFSHDAGRLEIGALALPEELAVPEVVEMDGKTFPISLETVSYSNGDEEAYVAKGFHVCVVAVPPTVWERQAGDDGPREVAPAGLAHPLDHGFRSRLRPLVIVREFQDVGFMVLSIKSTVCKGFWAALDASRRFRKAADRLLSQARGKTVTLPEYAFYLPLYVGKGERKNKRMIYPLCHAIPETPTDANIRALMIPAEVRDFIQGNLETVRKWQEEGPRVFGQVATIDEEGGNGDGNGEEAALTRLKVEIDGLPDSLAHLNGKSLAELLQREDGKALIDWLASAFEPSSAEEEKLAEAAVALQIAGRTAPRNQRR